MPPQTSDFQRKQKLALNVLQGLVEHGPEYGKNKIAIIGGLAKSHLLPSYIPYLDLIKIRKEACSELLSEEAALEMNNIDFYTDINAGGLPNLLRKFLKESIITTEDSPIKHVKCITGDDESSIIYNFWVDERCAGCIEFTKKISCEFYSVSELPYASQVDLILLDISACINLYKPSMEGEDKLKLWFKIHEVYILVTLMGPQHGVELERLGANYGQILDNLDVFIDKDTVIDKEGKMGILAKKDWNRNFLRLIHFYL